MILMIGVPRIISFPTERVILGESPVWDERAQVLYWVDIERGHLHECDADGSSAQITRIGERIGCVALRERGGFIAGLEHRVSFLSLDPLAIETVADLKREPAGNRCNDGKCDSRGRFWVGTSHSPEKAASGWLYRVDLNGRMTPTAGPFICVNGPALSPDGNRLYCVDTYGKVIYRYCVDGAGELTGRQVFVRFEDPAWGYPDGLTCDVEGYVWVAHWGGERVSRFSPAGMLVQTIDLPVPHITSCTFGGADLHTLFITTASLGLDLASDHDDLSGALFAVDLEVAGLAAHRFGD
jgi:D-xylonolactonase